MGKVNDPVYLLKMTTRNDKGDLEEVECSLDQHQLLDMRRKVQDATAQVPPAKRVLNQVLLTVLLISCRLGVC